MTKLTGVIKSESKLEGNLGIRNEISVNIIGTGARGKEGKSAYETWLDLGNEGTEEDFMAFLREVAFELTNYEELDKKPRIESVELIGNKTFKDLGISNINEVEINNIF